MNNRENVKERLKKILDIEAEEKNIPGSPVQLTFTFNGSKSIIYTCFTRARLSAVSKAIESGCSFGLFGDNNKQETWYWGKSEIWGEILQKVAENLVEKKKGSQFSVEDLIKDSEKGPEIMSDADILMKYTRNNKLIKLENPCENNNSQKEAFIQKIKYDLQMEGNDMNDERTYEEYKNRIAKELSDNGRQIILTGAPGTGKTKMAKEVIRQIRPNIPSEEGYYNLLKYFSDKKREYIAALNNTEVNQNTGKLKMDTDKAFDNLPYVLVQFHPSYDYTDFVEGLRPVTVRDSENNISSEISFRKIDGIFKEFCRNVIRFGIPDNNYFFIIDEINRADLSKVFGELMYCLESDKRGKENSIKTQYQNLPSYEIDSDGVAVLIPAEKDDFAEGFYIPENVIIIGTMNDIDRSVESMDFALRRRFLWMEIVVSESLIKSSIEAMLTDNLRINDDQKNLLAGLIAKNIMSINKTIEKEGERYGLNRQYFISQGQFSGLPKGIWKMLVPNDTEKKEDRTVYEFLAKVFELRIESLLREYLRGESEKDIDDFVEACKPKAPGGENPSSATKKES